MIPSMNIIACGNIAPWAEQRQVEQDLVISRAIVELFSDDFLKGALRFRGGTALNKLHFPAPLRYSEDIDLVRTTRGPIKPVLSRVREILQPWLGDAGRGLRGGAEPSLPRRESVVHRQRHGGDLLTGRNAGHQVARLAPTGQGARSV